MDSAATTKHCPLDSTVLIAFEHDGHKMDRCPHCGGLWFTNEQFAKLVRIPDEMDAIEAADKPEGVEPPGIGFDTCPLGHGPMERYEYDEASHIVIDRCTTCYGIWLDDKEASEIAKHNRGSANPQLNPDNRPPSPTLSFSTNRRWTA